MQATLFSWQEIAEDNPIQLLTRRMITGEQMLVARVNLKKGCDVHTHHHASEQIAVMVSGHVRWGLGEGGSKDFREVEMRGGQVMWLPANVPHSVYALEDS